MLAAIGWTDALRIPGARRILSIGSLTDATGTGIAAACLPFYALLVLGASPGMLAAAMALGGLASILGAVPAGILAARWGVRPYLMTVRTIAGLSFIAIAITGQTWVFICGVTVTGACVAGAGGLAQMLTVAAVGETERSGVLAITRSLRNVGYLIASLIALPLLASSSTSALRAAMLLNGISFLALVGCYWRLRLTSTCATAPERHSMFVAIKDARYMTLVVMSAVFVTSVLVLDLGIPLLVEDNDLPRTLVAIVLGINTALVILAQFNIAKRVESVVNARRGLVVATAAFVVMAVLLAATGNVPVGVAVALTLLAAVALTIGEMLESPAWWTISYEVAPEHARSEYLSAFDMGAALTFLAGPTLIVLVVRSGAVGWLLLGAAMVAACATVSVLTATAARSETSRQLSA